MLRFIICDDEKEHNAYLLGILLKVCESQHIKAEISLVTSNSKEAVKFVKENKDRYVIILDIDYEQDQNGIDFAHSIRDVDMDSIIIYITAHQEYSIYGYATRAFDFLLKPVNESKIHTLVNQLAKYMESSQCKTLFLNIGSVTHFVLVDKIMYISKFGKKLFVYAEDNVYQSLENIKDIAERLLKFDYFIFCHKSHIVNKKYVKTYTNSTGVIVMKNGDICSVSRPNRKKVKEFLRVESI